MVLGMHAIDIWLFDWLNASIHSPQWLVDATVLYSEYFPTLAISTMLVCLVFGSRRLRQGMAMCLVAMLLAWCATHLIRWGFPMERPYEMGLGDKWIEHGARPRFPSLHATVSFAFASGISLWCATGTAARHWKLLVWTVAALMGWSRVYVGVHLPFDILSGLVVGIACVYAVQALRAPVTSLGKSAAYWIRRAGP